VIQVQQVQLANLVEFLVRKDHQVSQAQLVLQAVRKDQQVLLVQLGLGYKVQLDTQGQGEKHHKLVLLDLQGQDQLVQQVQK
jgi:hypothetical protein